jgi:hypothetical protein
VNGSVKKSTKKKRNLVDEKENKLADERERERERESEWRRGSLKGGGEKCKSVD